MKKRSQLSLSLSKGAPVRKRSPAKKSSSSKAGTIRLSPSTGLNLFRDCPRCFWLHYNKNVHRPRGIFPSLPGGMDLVLKDYFDQFRGSLPPELEGKVRGTLVPDQKLLARWRNWRTGLEYKDQDRNAALFGALDDCLLEGTRYVPLDYKTKGSPPRPGDSERYYQTQLDTYALLLHENGYPVADVAYLIYYSPKHVEKNGVVHFNVHPVEVGVDVDRARSVFGAAVDFLRGPMPGRHSSCEYCTWVGELDAFPA